MEEETMENSTSSNSSLYYVLGAIVLVAVIGAGYLLRPKPANVPAAGGKQVFSGPTPTPGPITRLACETQYYNPVLGFPKYYISVEGIDPSGPESVDCTMTVTQENRIVTTEKVTTNLVAKPERNGNVFKCTTQGLELKPTIPTKVDVALRDDQGAKASCSAIFSLPK
jgi:hypothetical protein